MSVLAAGSPAAGLTGGDAGVCPATKIAMPDLRVIPYPQTVAVLPGALRLGRTRYATTNPTETVRMAKRSLSAYLPKSGPPMIMRRLAALLATVSFACLAAPVCRAEAKPASVQGRAVPARRDEPGIAAAPPIAVAPDEPTIERETPHGGERMLTLTLANPGAEPLRGLRLETRSGRRELLDVPPGGARDTLWVREGGPSRLPARLFQGEQLLWQGDLMIPAPATTVRIPRSTCVRLADLKPLALRGTNYYPRSQPWPGIWRAMDEAAFEAEFREMDRLHINWIRTFYNLDTETGLHRKDGSFTARLIGRIDALLRVAARHRVKVMLTIGLWGGPGDTAMQRRFFRTGVEPFIYDGRILMWDLINEPGGSDGPRATPELGRWIQEMWAYLAGLDAQHLATVGLCWQFDQLRDLGVTPPVGQYHNYSGAVGVQPPGNAPIRNVADDLRSISKQIDNRPLVIGEFGYASVPDIMRKDAAEARQEEITRWVLEGAEAAARSGVNLVGLANWCAFHFLPDWMGRGEQSFGVIRLDGTLKPAGVTLRDTYARWRSRRRAPWEGIR